MDIGNIFNRENNKIKRQIQRLKDFASEFSENLKTVKSIEGFEEFEGYEALFDHLKNRSSRLFVMPGGDLLKYLDLKSPNSQEADYIKNRYPEDIIEQLDRVIIFTVVLGEYLMRAIERLPRDTQIKMTNTMTKYDDINDDLMAFAYDFPKIDENNFIPIKDLFRRLVETKKYAGFMLDCLLGKKDENNKIVFPVKTHHKLLRAIRENDFELFEEVVEQSDKELTDGLSMIYANIYPFAVAMESHSSNVISPDDVLEFLSSNGYEITTPNSSTSKVFGQHIGVVYIYLEHVRGEFPNEAKGIDHFFEINDLCDFMDSYAEWCYQETRQLIDARKEAIKNKEQASNPSTELNDTNNKEGLSSETKTDTDPSDDEQSTTSGDEKKTRKKDPNYYIHLDEKPEVIKMLVEGLVEGYTTEEFGAFPSLVTTKKLYDDYDDIEELLTFFFTGDKSNFSKKIPYNLIWTEKYFYLYLLMQFIFNKKGFKNADEVINQSTDPSKSLISETHVKADFRGKNTWKEVEAVFGIKPNSIKNSTPTIGQKNEETEQMMKKLAQFWLDCKNSGKG